MSDQIWHYLALATEMDRKYRPRIMALVPTSSGSSGGAAAVVAPQVVTPALPVTGAQVNSLFHHHPLIYGPSLASNQRCAICPSNPSQPAATDFYSVFTTPHYHMTICMHWHFIDIDISNCMHL
jgi:hypothetical protein